MPRERYYVTISRPVGASVTDTKDYIRDAINGWKVGFQRGDAFFKADLDATVVREPMERREQRRLSSIPRTWGEVALENLTAKSEPPVVVKILSNCMAGEDGDCFHTSCPQMADGEPERSGRHCPLDKQAKLE
jgi:hypothetical protein